MSENVQHEDALCPVVDTGNQPVVVGVDVEDSSSTNDVRMREDTPHVNRRVPIGAPGDPIPIHRRDQRIRIPFAELENGWLADYPQN